MLRLKENIDVIDFLNTISGTCVGNVWFCTRQGDEINLRSELSRYVFLTMCTQEDLLRMGSVRLDEPRDNEPLGRFLLS